MSSLQSLTPPEAQKAGGEVVGRAQEASPRWLLGRSPVLLRSNVSREAGDARFAGRFPGRPLNSALGGLV